jgi:hypothetical protein
MVSNHDIGFVSAGQDAEIKVDTFNFTRYGLLRGWGYEDVDLRERLLRRGLVHAHRDGTFRSLPHVDLGSHPDGTPTADPGRTRRSLSPVGSTDMARDAGGPKLATTGSTTASLHWNFRLSRCFVPFRTKRLPAPGLTR